MPDNSRFLTGLFASRTPAQSREHLNGWRVESPLVFFSETQGEITVPVGFLTDFASVPRLPFAYLFFGDRAHAAAVVHDWLCRIDYPMCRITWAAAAVVFLEAMKAEGVPFYQRWPMYSAVHFAGSLKPNACTPDHQRDRMAA